jgi:hypothetical protein
MELPVSEDRANHIARETEEAQAELPDGALVIASNGTGDRLLLLAGGDEPHFFDHETGETRPVEIDW